MRASHTFLGNYCMFLDSFILRHVFCRSGFWFSYVTLQISEGYKHASWIVLLCRYFLVNLQRSLWSFFLLFCSSYSFSDLFSFENLLYSPKNMVHKVINCLSVIAWVFLFWLRVSTDFNLSDSLYCHILHVLPTVSLHARYVHWFTVPVSGDALVCLQIRRASQVPCQQQHIVSSTYLYLSFLAGHKLSENSQ